MLGICGVGRTRNATRPLPHNGKGTMRAQLPLGRRISPHSCDRDSSSSTAKEKPAVACCIGCWTSDGSAIRCFMLGEQAITTWLASYCVPDGCFKARGCVSSIVGSVIGCVRLGGFRTLLRLRDALKPGGIRVLILAMHVEMDRRRDAFRNLARDPLFFASVR